MLQSPCGEGGPVDIPHTLSLPGPGSTLASQPPSPPFDLHPWLSNLLSLIPQLLQSSTPLTPEPQINCWSYLIIVPHLPQVLA